MCMCESSVEGILEEEECVCEKERIGMGRRLYVRELFQSYVLQLPHQAPHCNLHRPLAVGSWRILGRGGDSLR